MDCVRVSYTKKECKAILRHNKKHPKQYRKEIRMYYCEICNAWHLTSKEYVPNEQHNQPVKSKHVGAWLKLLINGKTDNERSAGSL